MSKKRIALGVLAVCVAAVAVGGWYVTSYVPWYETPAEYEAYIKQSFKRAFDEGITEKSWKYWQITRKGNIAMERILRNPKATDWEYREALQNKTVMLGYRLMAGDERAIREVMAFPERAEKDGRHELVQELKEGRLEFELAMACYRKDKAAYAEIVERINLFLADEEVTEGSVKSLAFDAMLNAEPMLGKEAADALLEKYTAMLEAYGPQAVESFLENQEFIRKQRERSQTAE